MTMSSSPKKRVDQRVSSPIDMVQQIIAFLRLTHEKLMANEENVANGLLRLRGSSATLDMHKLVVCQVKANDGYGIFFNASLVLIQHFGICIGRWRSIGSVHNIPKIYGCQQNFNFELSKVVCCPIEVVDYSRGLALK